MPKLVMEFEQERVAYLEKKYREEQAERLSGITDPQELLMEKLSLAQMIPLELAKNELKMDFGYELFVGKAEIKTPVRIEWQSGRGKPDDVEWGPSEDLVVISPRVRSLLEEEGITGWKSYQIELYDKLGMLVEGYSALGVTGRCGPADPAKAVKRLTTYPGGVFPEYYGHYFDPGSWDGSDIFLPNNGNTTTIVTERVKNLLKKNKVRHVAVDTNLVDCMWPPFEILYPELVKQSQ